MYESGTLSGSKAFSITQITSMPGVLTDIKGEPLKFPFTKSYGEGFDLPSYWNTLYAVRKGTVDRAVNTRESGALNKALLNVNRKLLITIEDCNTKDYLIADINDKDLTTRVLAVTYPNIAKRNDVITPEILMKLKQNNINEIKVRSPLTCEAIEG
ncbi:MAG: hypothetical protein N2053_13365, partial [Chitinispirillaceae bacterium]|nr:hypothetical protein [Chitinispirillaceae bacterium]